MILLSRFIVVNDTNTDFQSAVDNSQSLAEKAVIVATAMARRIPVYASDNKSGLPSCLYFGKNGLEVSICNGGGSWCLAHTDGFSLEPPPSPVLRCPMCGGDAHTYSVMPNAAIIEWRVTCRSCGAESGICDTKKSAIAAWNRRA